MKSALFLMICMVSSFYGLSQTFTANTQTGPNTYSKMTVQIQNGVASITRQELNLSAGITLAGISDFANVGIVNGRFTIPNDGITYWLVPFQGTSALQSNGGNYCIDCFCQGQGGETPSCNLKVNNICGGSCGGCKAVTRPCDGAVSLEGAFAIIKASQVIFN